MSEMKLPRLPKSNYPDMTYQRRFIGAVYTPEQMKAYAMRAVLAEREACAQLCEAMRPTEREFDQRFYTACTLNANAIRNRDKE